jgi:hypothetical protein
MRTRIFILSFLLLGLGGGGGLVHGGGAVDQRSAAHKRLTNPTGHPKDPPLVCKELSTLALREAAPGLSNRRHVVAARWRRPGNILRQTGAPSGYFSRLSVPALPPVSADGGME